MGLGLTTRKNALRLALPPQPMRQNSAKHVREIIRAPVRAHGREPDEARERIQRSCAGSCLDLFARAANAGGGGVDLVMHPDGVGFKEAVASLAGGVPPVAPPPCAPARLMPAPPADDERQKALQLWDEAGPLAGTSADRYLIERAS